MTTIAAVYYPKEGAMQTDSSKDYALSPWWRKGVLLALAIGFSIEIIITFYSYKNIPPIPENVVNQAGEIIFTKNNILNGQQVFLKYGLMENGSIFGHGAYLGPDFSAQYLHELGQDTRQLIAKTQFDNDFYKLEPSEQQLVTTETAKLLKVNKFDPVQDKLIFSTEEILSFKRQIKQWQNYFSDEVSNGGLQRQYISDPKELFDLTSFFAWTAWASIANRPGENYSYTNNFPYDPELGNKPTSETVLWSALSLITLLTGTALVLFVWPFRLFRGSLGQACFG